MKYLRIFGKTEKFRNEDSEIEFVTKTIVCQHKDDNMWSQATAFSLPFYNIFVPQIFSLLKNFVDVIARDL